MRQRSGAGYEGFGIWSQSQREDTGESERGEVLGAGCYVGVGVELGGSLWITK